MLQLHTHCNNELGWWSSQVAVYWQGHWEQLMMKPLQYKQTWQGYILLAIPKQFGFSQMQVTDKTHSSWHNNNVKNPHLSQLIFLENYENFWLGFLNQCECVIIQLVVPRYKSLNTLSPALCNFQWCITCTRWDYYYAQETLMCHYITYMCTAHDVPNLIGR